MATRERHVLGISGGKDSAALAVLLHKEIPEMEYFFCDTHKELDETYAYLARIETRLGIKIKRLNPRKGFDYWLNVKGGYLPSPNVRWCTERLKIEPLEEWLGDDPAISYVGIRADENRTGYISTKPSIKAVYPFQERGIDKAGVIRLLDDYGIGMPDYYSWRTRSGCFFCFFQRKSEWIGLHDQHPELFWKAVEYEERHADGRRFTWSHGESLRELLGRRDEVLATQKAADERALTQLPSRPLAQTLAAAFDDDEEELGCLVCHL
jgi:3'-phosphoadenosine 5'-phosphosulfate sulfotransferase (PAPS reductase)/FAD synthetase